MTRDEELARIAAYLNSCGATKCPPPSADDPPPKVKTWYSTQHKKRRAKATGKKVRKISPDAIG